MKMLWWKARDEKSRGWKIWEWKIQGMKCHAPNTTAVKRRLKIYIHKKRRCINRAHVYFDQFADTFLISKIYFIHLVILTKDLFQFLKCAPFLILRSHILLKFCSKLCNIKYSHCCAHIASRKYISILLESTYFVSPLFEDSLYVTE